MSPNRGKASQTEGSAGDTLRASRLAAVRSVKNVLAICGPNARIGVERQASTPKSFNTLRYSAAMGDDTLADAETFAEPFAALVSSSGLSEWRDFPSK